MRGLGAVGSGSSSPSSLSGAPARAIRLAFSAFYGADASAPAGTAPLNTPPPAAVPPPPPSISDAPFIVAAAELRSGDAGAGPQPPPLTLLPAPSASSPASEQLAALHAFTITNDYYTFTCEFLQSALLNGVVPHVVGFGGHEGSLPSGVAFRWGLGKPILALRRPIEALAARLGGDVLVLIADAHDSLLAVPGAALVRKFRAVQARAPLTRVLISAERSCFPIEEADCARFPPAPDELPYRNLNSGGWMGAARHVLDVLDAVELMYPGGIDAANVNDQAALQYLYIDAFARRLLGLQLDYANEVFMAMHMAQAETAAHAAAPGRVCNTLSGSCPALLHFNGGSKSQQAAIDAALLTTRALEAPGAAPLRRELAAYHLPELEMSFRDFCCDPRWTNPGAFNKVPVRHMRCDKGDVGD